MSTMKCSIVQNSSYDTVILGRYLITSKLLAYKVNRLRYDGEMPDEKDRPFYEVSLSKDDSYLVTGNLKHFPSTPKVVSPSEMMAILRVNAGGSDTSDQYT